MADVRVKNLNAITTIDKQNDYLPIEDTSADETKKITIKQISGEIAGWDLTPNADGTLSLKDNTIGDNRLGDKATQDTNLGIALQSYYTARNMLANNGNSSFGASMTKANVTFTNPDNASGIIPSTYLAKTFQVQATTNAGSTYFYLPEQSGSGVTSIITGFWLNKTKLQAYINALVTTVEVFSYWFNTTNPMTFSKQELQDILDKKLFFKSKSQVTGWQNTLTFRVLAHQDDWVYFAFKTSNFSGTPVNWKFYLLWNNTPETLLTNPWEFLNFTMLKNEKFIIPWGVYKDGTSAIPEFNLVSKGEIDQIKSVVNTAVSYPIESYSNQGITFKQRSYIEKSGNYLNYLNGQNSTSLWDPSYGTMTSTLETTGEIIPSSYGLYKRTFTSRTGGNDWWVRQNIGFPENTKRIKFGAWFEKSSLLALANALPDGGTDYIRFWIFLNNSIHGEKLLKVDMLGFLNTPKNYKKSSSITNGGISSTTTVYCGGESTNWVFLIFDTVINSGTISTSSFYWEMSGGSVMNANPYTLFNLILLLDEAAEYMNGYMVYKEVGGGVSQSNIITKEYVDSKISTITTVTPTKNKIRVLKSGTNIYVRSHFNETKDVVIQYGINGAGTNENIGIQNTYLIDKAAADTTTAYTAGTIIHSAGDDICPWYTQNTGYIGANHGFNTAKVTVASHDKTTADVGSLWTDGVRQWYLADIINSTSLHFSCKTSGSPWTATSSITGSTLTHVSGATNTSTVTITAQELLQAEPITLNRDKKYLLDGKYDLTDGVVGYADFFDIVDLYDMVDPSTIIISYPVNWSNGSAWVRNKITYRFGNYGSTVVNYTAEILRPLNLGYMGFIQSAKMTKGSYDKVFAYMPKVLTNNGYDLKAIIDFTSNPSVPLNYTDTYLESASNPPDRLIEFLGDNDGTKRVGYAHGYNIVYGHGKSASRDANNANQWNIHTSSKSYPHCIDNLGNISAGTVFQVIAYRQYFDPQLYPNTTCVYHHKVGNNDMVYIDIHQNVTNLKIQLPSFLTGKAITLVEKNSDLTLVTDELVTSDGVIVTVTNNYGYAVLKLI
ncbi:MAG: hypothetical protein LCH52_08195 [Bacteroidetes bacterium]|nr:hypothetical protein [Bacteroidota bacterium]